MIFTTLHPITSSLLKFEPSSLSSSHLDSPWQETSSIIDTDKEWGVSVDVPGVKAGDIDIKVENGLLFISGVRKFESSDGHAIKKLKFSKSFQLPMEKYGDRAVVDPQQLQATLSDGVLVLKAPKRAKPEPVTISIKINSDTAKAIDSQIVVEEKDKKAVTETHAADSEDKAPIEVPLKENGSEKASS